MPYCDDDHEPLEHRGRDCPACKALNLVDELEAENEKLNIQIEGMEDR